MKYANVVTMEERFSDIYVYYYNENREKVCEKSSVENYFFIKNMDVENFKELILNLERNPKYPEDETNYEEGFKSIYGEDLVKIIPNKFEFWKIRKLLWMNGIKTYEAKLSVYLKFLLENDVQFTKDRRVGIIDIEVERGNNGEGLDVINTPSQIEIITIYDYNEDKYMCFFLNKKNEIFDLNNLDFKVELFSFGTEKELIVSFINKFKELNYDLIFGWNVINYDFAYILNRCDKLKIDKNQFTNFSGDKKVECRRVEYKGGTRNYYDVSIPGLNIIDLIEIMKKANAYDLKPASFSLKSTVAFYLKDEKKGEQGKTLEENLKYNIQDVRLVKLLNDKYELKTFLYGIHLEMGNGIPLEHCVHNSIVIIYKIKQMFPNIILPDTINYFEFDNIYYPFKDYDVVITAAKVLSPNAGIYNRVVFFDFKSLYPSIIRTWNISPDTLLLDGRDDVNNNIVSDIDMNIGNKRRKNKLEYIKNINVEKKFRVDFRGIYPQLCEYLVNRRLIHQKEARRIKSEKGIDNYEYKSAMYKDDNQKQVLNSIFGVGSFENFELYNPYVAAAITAIGRNLLSFVDKYSKSRGWIPIMGDTDSCAIGVLDDISDEDLTIELNNALKEYVLKTWPNTKNNYCLIFEHQKSMKKFIMKTAKKKYFGFLNDDKSTFICKGYPIVQHSCPKFVKEVLTMIFTAFLLGEDSFILKEKLKVYKGLFKQLSADEIGISLNLAKDPEDYDTNIPHAKAAEYSNNYLGTNFKGNEVGKFLFVKNPGSKKYPLTEYVFLDEDALLPQEFIIDYEAMWDKLVLGPIETLSELKDLNIDYIINKNKTLLEFTK